MILPAGLGLFALGGSLADGRRPVTLEEVTALRSDDVNGFDRRATRYWSPEWGDRSDRYRDALIVSSVALLFVPELARGRLTGAATVGVMLAESYFLLSGTTHAVKGLVGRRRPYLYNASMSPQERLGVTDPDDNDAVLSFFSGHSAAAFTLATLTSQVFTDVHGRSTLSTLVWATSLSAAALTAYARVRAGMHYPSDVLAGAVVGGAIGVLVPKLHRRGASDRVALIAGPDRVGLRVRVGARAARSDPPPIPPAVPRVSARARPPARRGPLRAHRAPRRPGA